MKKRIYPILAFALALTLSSCNISKLIPSKGSSSSNSSEPNSSNTSQSTSFPIPDTTHGTLKIVCLSNGYGSDWIDDLVPEWQKDHPHWAVDITATADANSIIQKHLYSANNDDDLYISNSRAWKTYALTGKLLELDDFLNEEVDGMKVVDKINDEYKKSIYYNGHTYRLPWTSGVPGIYYNAKMFEENGWTVPETYEQLVTLCAKIKADNIPVGTSPKDTSCVAPFVFTGENNDYFDYVTFTWWAQLAGKSNIEDYLQYQSPATFSNSHPAFNALGQALQMWYNIFDDSTNYVDGSKGWGNHMAQQAFYNGYAAMMVNGDWIYNEILKYEDEGKPLRDGFELKVMNTPTATGAVFTNISYTIGEDQFIAIPKTSQHAEHAKSFIKFMMSDYTIKLFAEKGHGVLAYKPAQSIAAEDSYTNSLLDYAYHNPQRFTDWSDSPLYLNNVIGAWTEYSMMPYSRLLDGSVSSVSDYMELMSANAQSRWEHWQQQAEVN